MAITVNQQRPFGKSIFATPVAPKRFFPAAASQSGYPGELVIASSGRATIGPNNSTAHILGICEGTYSSTSADDPILTTVALPNHFYEFTLDGTGAVAQRFDFFALKDSDDTKFAVVDSATTSDVVCVIEFVGLLAQFETNGFTDRYGNDNAGTVNYPYSQYGGIGDTDPRVVVTFHPDACALTA